MGTEISPEDVRGPLRLAIVDDHELARESLQNTLSDEPDMEIVGEAANGRQALLLCSAFQAGSDPHGREDACHGRPGGYKGGQAKIPRD